MAGRMPDFKVKIKERRENGKQGEVGAGWVNEDGSVSITLNAGVVLSWRDDVIITAFPTVESTAKPKRAKKTEA